MVVNIKNNLEQNPNNENEDDPNKIQMRVPKARKTTKTVMNFKKENIIFANKEDANIEEINNDEFLINIEDEKPNDDIIVENIPIEPLIQPQENNPLADSIKEETQAIDDEVNLEFLFKQLGEVENVIIIEDDDNFEEVMLQEELVERKYEDKPSEDDKIDVKKILNDEDVLIINNIIVSDERKKEALSERLESKENIIINESRLLDKPEDKVDEIKATYVEPAVKMKDKKILVNLEDLEKEYSKKEQYLFGEVNQKNAEEMKLLNQEIELMHPRIIKNGQVLQHPVCTSMGNFCCSNSQINENLKELGLGMMCYFKVLKVFIWCFFVISIINIHLYYVYITSNTAKGVTGYRDLLFKTTIGNIASSKIK
jgi:hypothetical protein